jgi:hypothetical protein
MLASRSLCCFVMTISSGRKLSKHKKGTMPHPESWWDKNSQEMVVFFFLCVFPTLCLLRISGESLTATFTGCIQWPIADYLFKQYWTICTCTYWIGVELASKAFELLLHQGMPKLNLSSYSYVRSYTQSRWTWSRQGRGLRGEPLCRRVG